MHLGLLLGVHALAITAAMAQARHTPKCMQPTARPRPTARTPPHPTHAHAHAHATGVGICGAEGMQAVLASDVAIGQFRFLGPLLLVHGRWAYARAARMLSFFLYKNLLFGLTLFGYNAATLFSGQILYNGVCVRARERRSCAHGGRRLAHQYTHTHT